jgi:FAD synthase
MAVECIEWIRGEKKFDSPEELVKEMNRDKIQGKKIFETAQS